MRTRTAGLGRISWPAFLASLALAACGGERSGSASAGGSPESLTGQKWELVSLRGAGGDERTPPPGHVPTVTFGEEAVPGGEGPHRLGGSGGCNRMGGEWSVPEPGRLSVGELISTRMACLAPGAMEMEDAFFRALQAAERFEVRGDTLEIHSGDGGKLTFRAATASA